MLGMTHILVLVAVDTVVGGLLVGGGALAEGALGVDLQDVVAAEIEVGLETHVGALTETVLLLVLLQRVGGDGGEVALAAGTDRLGKVAGGTGNGLDHVLGAGNSHRWSIGIEVNITATDGGAHGEGRGVDGINEVGIAAGESDQGLGALGEQLGGVQAGDAAQLVSGLGGELVTGSSGHMGGDTLSDHMDDLLGHTLVGQFDQSLGDHGTGVGHIQHRVALEVSQGRAEVNDLESKSFQKLEKSEKNLEYLTIKSPLAVLADFHWSACSSLLV